MASIVDKTKLVGQKLVDTVTGSGVSNKQIEIADEIRAKEQTKARQDVVDQTAYTTKKIDKAQHKLADKQQTLNQEQQHDFIKREEKLVNEPGEDLKLYSKMIKEQALEDIGAQAKLNKEALKYQDKQNSLVKDQLKQQVDSAAKQRDEQIKFEELQNKQEIHRLHEAVDRSAEVKTNAPPPSAETTMNTTNQDTKAWNGTAEHRLSTYEVHWKHPCHTAFVASGATGWHEMPMKRNDQGHFVCAMPVYNGRNHFKFIIDSQWVASDDYGRCDNGLGDSNNFIDV